MTAGIMNKLRSCFFPVAHPFIPCVPAITIFFLLTVAWSTTSFCGEIHDAARSGDLKSVKTMPMHNPKLISSKDEDSMTPLHFAARDDHNDIVILLLSKKANVNDQDRDG